MKKTLISAENIEGHICRAGGKLFLDGAILTPGARDELTKRRITVLHGPCPEVSSCSMRAGACCRGGCAEGEEGAKAGLPGAGAGQQGEQSPEAVLARLMLGIETVLRKEYGVSNPQEIHAVSLKAIQVIKENI